MAEALAVVVSGKTAVSLAATAKAAADFFSQLFEQDLPLSPQRKDVLFHVGVVVHPLWFRWEGKKKTRVWLTKVPSNL